MLKEKIYKYPSPDDILIDEADFKLEMRDYYDAVKRKKSFIDLFVIIPAWIPIFTSNFKDFYGITGPEIRGFYIAIVSFGTLLWFLPALSMVLLWGLRFIFLVSVFKKYIWKYENWLRKKEVDPYKKVEDIKNRGKEN